MANAEATTTEITATAAKLRVHPVPEKASSKKGAQPERGEPKGQKADKGGGIFTAVPFLKPTSGQRVPQR